ncbi:hypothetical protein ACQ4M4_27400 [Leptolyngbya sp. AN02str]|uniref:hypothetical protein n=1 Tax=Leptolyngbya sp. AN02str TaxID=3423363 RepID=UPI003D31100E
MNFNDAALNGLVRWLLAKGEPVPALLSDRVPKILAELKEREQKAEQEKAAELEKAKGKKLSAKKKKH